MSGGRIATMALLAVLTATACAPPAVTAPRGDGPGPRAGGRLIHAGDPPRSLQPILDESTGLVTSLIYARLAVPDPQTGEMVPELGRWERARDGLTYSWTLDPLATWSDGTPITAQDWVTGLKAVGRSKRSIHAGALRQIKGFNEFAAGQADEVEGVRLDVADPKKWSVSLVRVSCAALDQLVGFVLPSHVFGKYVAAGTGDAIDRAPENDAPPVASGPFVLGEWRQGDQIVLKRNDRYWKGAALLDEYVLRFVSDPNARLTGLRSGEIDHMVGAPDVVSAVRDEPGITVRFAEGANYAFIGWNVRSATSPALADKRVRQALAYGLDVDTIIRTRLDGNATRIHAPHAPAWAFTRELVEYRHDPGKARELLDQAGHEPGADGIRHRAGARLAFTLRVPNEVRILRSIAEIAVEQYRELGVEVKLVSEPLASLQEKLDTGSPEIEAWMFQWRPPQRSDPDTEYLKFSSENIPDPATKRRGLNWSGYREPAVDRALAEARTPSDLDCSTAARRRHYETFSRRVNEDQPNLFLYAPRTPYLMASRVRGSEPGPWGAYWNVERWWMAP